jgi:hypothetical protein
MNYYVDPEFIHKQQEYGAKVHQEWEDAINTYSKYYKTCIIVNEPQYTIRKDITTAQKIKAVMFLINLENITDI